MLQSKLDGAFAQYHNEVQDMQAKSDEVVSKNKVAPEQEQRYAAVLSSTHWKCLAVV
jgi:hypothetical protein